MDEFAPQLSKALFVLFGLTCVLIIVVLGTKMPRTALKVVVWVGLSFAAILTLGSAVLYIWHHHYR